MAQEHLGEVLESLVPHGPGLGDRPHRRGRGRALREAWARAHERERARVAVLLSGRGSNFVALAEACARGEVPAEIVLVVSNKADAPGLERARERGHPRRR